METQFDFDAGGNRARQMKKRIDLSGSRTEGETLYLGSYEREIHGTRASASAIKIHTKTVHRHRLGGAVYTRTVDGSGTTVKLTTVIKDHLGSTDLLLTGTWNGSSFSNPTAENQAFDPWGERRKADTWETHRISQTDAYRTTAGDYKRGYTGHEQLDDSGLIHMNGRIYDPELGRFLSPDPVVQIPEYSQDFNRYSYVLNNPLNATDPSGFSWLSKAFSKIGNWLKQNWRTVVSIVVGAILMLTPGGQAFISMIGGMIAPGAVGASWTIAQGVVISGAQMVGGAVVGGIMGGANAALAGGDLGDVLRGMAVGAIQGAISSGPLHALEGVKGMQFAHVAGHGVLGGASNAAMGGKFQDGFLSAAAAAAAGHTGITSRFNGDNALHIAARTSVASAIGGTASAIGGGKFANGAYTAAFQHLLNSEMNTIPRAVGHVFHSIITFFAQFFSTMAGFWNSPSAVAQNAAAPWMTIAAKEVGITETTNRARVLEYHSTTRQNLRWVDDRGPWCSSFTNWVMEQSGIQGTDSASSQSWLGWGEKVDGPAYGAIAISSAGGGRGHVGFIAGRNGEGKLIMLGGNQSNSVRYSQNTSVLQYRFPHGYTPNYNLPTISGSGPALNFTTTR